MVNPNRASDFSSDGVGILEEGTRTQAVWFGGGASVPSFTAPLNSYYYRKNGEIYWQSASPSGSTWNLQASGSDHHAGYYCIPGGLNVTIDTNKQMRVKGAIKVAGTVTINGMLVVD